MQETGCLFVGLILVLFSVVCIGEIIQLFQIRLLCLHKTVYTLCLDTVQQRLGFVDVLFRGIELFPCLIHTHLVARRVGSCRSDHLLVFQNTAWNLMQIRIRQYIVFVFRFDVQLIV